MRGSNHQVQALPALIRIGHAGKGPEQFEAFFSHLRHGRCDITGTSSGQSVASSVEDAPDFVFGEAKRCSDLPLCSCEG